VLWCFGTGDLVLSSHVSLFVCNVIDSELLARVEKQMCFGVLEPVIWSFPPM